MTLLPTDNNGNPIEVMAVRSGIDVALSSTPVELLPAEPDCNRIVRLFPTDEGVKIGMGDSPVAHVILSVGVPEYFELEAGLSLYGAGSGVINIGIMG